MNIRPRERSRQIKDKENSFTCEWEQCKVDADSDIYHKYFKRLQQRMCFSLYTQFMQHVRRSEFATYTERFPPAKPDFPRALCKT